MNISNYNKIHIDNLKCKSVRQTSGVVRNIVKILV